MLMSRCVVGEDGKTAYERLKGRRCNMEVVPFGEKVFYKPLSSHRIPNAAARFEFGAFIGMIDISNEVVLVDEKTKVPHCEIDSVPMHY